MNYNYGRTNNIFANTANNVNNTNNLNRSTNPWTQTNTTNTNPWTTNNGPTNNIFANTNTNNYNTGYSNNRPKLGTYRANNYIYEKVPQVKLHKNWTDNNFPVSINANDAYQSLTVLEMRIEDYYLIRRNQLQGNHKTLLSQAITKKRFNEAIINSRSMMTPATQTVVAHNPIIGLNNTPSTNIFANNAMRTSNTTNPLLNRTNINTPVNPFNNNNSNPFNNQTNLNNNLSNDRTLRSNSSNNIFANNLSNNNSMGNNNIFANNNIPNNNIFANNNTSANIFATNNNNNNMFNNMSNNSVQPSNIFANNNNNIFANQMSNNANNNTNNIFTQSRVQPNNIFTNSINNTPNNNMLPNNMFQNYNHNNNYQDPLFGKVLVVDSNILKQLYSKQIPQNNDHKYDEWHNQELRIRPQSPLSYDFRRREKTPEVKIKIVDVKQSKKPKKIIIQDQSEGQETMHQQQNEEQQKEKSLDVDYRIETWNNQILDRRRIKLKVDNTSKTQIEQKMREYLKKEKISNKIADIIISYRHNNGYLITVRQKLVNLPQGYHYYGNIKDGRIQNLIIINSCGQIKWPGITDASQIDFSDSVEIQKNSVSVYQKYETFPELGQGLNKECIVTFNTCELATKMKKQNKYNKQDLEKKLRKGCEKLGCQFVQYSENTQHWTIKVKNFKK